MATPFVEKLSSLKKEEDKKIISFSLYGTDVKYCLGAIRNIEFAEKYYPGWICRFYCSQEVSNLEDLAEKNCELLVLESKIPPMYWRFFAVADPNASAVIVRDADSLVNPREAAAVEEWLGSDYTLHTMHDCDMRGGHMSIIMGGMWGIKCPIDFDIISEIDLYARKTRNYKFRYSDDQQFLAKKLYPIFKNSCIDHHSKPRNSKFANPVPFPDHAPLEMGSFVGERISPFQLKKFNYRDSNIDSRKLFVMPHLGPLDHIELNGLFYELVDKYDEVIIPTKPHSNSLVDYLFGGEPKIKIERIVKDAEGMSLFETKYKDTHRFLGLGNHGKKEEEKNFVQKCFKQAGIEYVNRFLIKSSPHYKNDIIDSQEKKIKTKLASLGNPVEPKPKRSSANKISGEPKISVLVGTFNRWKFLNKTIESIKSQTYKNIEIIVINDGSSDKEYNNIIKDVIWINLPENSESFRGFKCRSFVYNYGLSIAKGEYIAFCDDDDAWYPEKLEHQISEMQKHRSGMSATEAYGGKGLFDNTKRYRLYNNEVFKKIVKKKTDGKIPKFITKEFLSRHNFLIGSSVVIRKDILDKVGFLNEEKRYKKGQDYELWKRALGITDCIYIDKPLTYYDLGHGNGREY